MKPMMEKPMAQATAIFLNLGHGGLDSGPWLRMRDPKMDKYGALDTLIKRILGANEF